MALVTPSDLTLAQQKMILYSARKKQKMILY
jgi:hypothetical protein